MIKQLSSCSWNILQNVLISLFEFTNAQQIQNAFWNKYVSRTFFFFLSGQRRIVSLVFMLLVCFIQFYAVCFLSRYSLILQYSFWMLSEVSQKDEQMGTV